MKLSRSLRFRLFLGRQGYGLALTALYAVAIAIGIVSVCVPMPHWLAVQTLTCSLALFILLAFPIPEVLRIRFDLVGVDAELDKVEALLDAVEETRAQNGDAEIIREIHFTYLANPLLGMSSKYRPDRKVLN